ncbi:MAG: sugar transferase [Actinobacteria bacterium]|nr:sugar transferase [Actinomycetota bacterium]
MRSTDIPAQTQDEVDAPAPGGAAGPGEQSLVERFQAMSHAYERRRADGVLRALDLLIAGGSLLLLSPFIMLVSALLLIGAGRPVLYRGVRVGRFGRVFTMYKFRTLSVDAEQRLGPYYGDELTERTKHETVRFGAAIRALHLDEVPQLANVVRGEMSIVGPRPIRPSFFEELCERIPQYWQRLVVRPGVTGFAQTRITREEDWAFKLAHDLEYIADRSVLLYFRVLLATVVRVLGRVGRGISGSGRRAEP